MLQHMNVLLFVIISQLYIITRVQSQSPFINEYNRSPRLHRRAKVSRSVSNENFVPNDQGSILKMLGLTEDNFYKDPVITPEGDKSYYINSLEINLEPDEVMSFEKNLFPGSSFTDETEDNGVPSSIDMIPISGEEDTGFSDEEPSIELPKVNTETRESFNQIPNPSNMYEKAVNEIATGIVKLEATTVATNITSNVGGVKNPAYEASEYYDKDLKDHNRLAESSDSPYPPQLREQGDATMTRGQTQNNQNALKKPRIDYNQIIKIEEPQVAKSRKGKLGGVPNPAYEASEFYDQDLKDLNRHQFEEGDSPYPPELREYGDSPRTRGQTQNSSNTQKNGSSGTSKLEGAQVANNRKGKLGGVPNPAYEASEFYDQDLKDLNRHQFEEGDSPYPPELREYGDSPRTRGQTQNASNKQKNGSSRTSKLEGAQVAKNRKGKLGGVPNPAYEASEFYDQDLKDLNRHQFEEGDSPYPPELREYGDSPRTRGQTQNVSNKQKNGASGTSKLEGAQVAKNRKTKLGGVPNPAYEASEFYDQDLKDLNRHQFEEGDSPYPPELRENRDTPMTRGRTPNNPNANNRKKGQSHINQAYIDSLSYDDNLKQLNRHKFSENDGRVPVQYRDYSGYPRKGKPSSQNTIDPLKYYKENEAANNGILKAVLINPIAENAVESTEKFVPTYGVNLEDLEKPKLIPIINESGDIVYEENIGGKTSQEFIDEQLSKNESWIVEEGLRNDGSHQAKRSGESGGENEESTTDITFSEKEMDVLSAFIDAEMNNVSYYNPVYQSKGMPNDILYESEFENSQSPASIYFGPNTPEKGQEKSLDDLIGEQLHKTKPMSIPYNVNPKANDILSSAENREKYKEARREKGRRETLGKEDQGTGYNIYDLVKELNQQESGTLEELIDEKFGIHTRQAEGDVDLTNEINPSDPENMGELPDDAGDQTSYIEWCEGSARKRITSMDCHEVTFVPPFPSCYCIEGIVSIRLDTSKNCETGLQFAKAGCFNFEALGHGVRSIRVESGLDTKSFVIATEKKNDFTSNWEFNIPSENAGVNNIDMTHNVQILNGELFQDDEGNNCVQQLKTGIVRVYRGIYGNYNVTNEEMQRCPGFAIGDSRLVMEHPIVGSDFQLCTPTCPAYQTQEASDKDSQISSQLDTESRDDLSDKDMSCKPIPGQLKSLHDDLNTKILRRSIDTAFMKPNSDTFVYEPQSTFKLLETMADITEKLCREAGIPRRLIDVGIDLFKVAHEGRGYYFNEGIEPKRYRFMHDALTSCLQNTIPYTFKKTDCDGTLTHVVNGTEFVPIKLSEEHEYFDHHVVLDIPWNIVDLINIACVDSFHHSYRMYHEMEQGMEKLYTKELRSLWKYPDFPRNFYERLFGAFWEHSAKNLELCVEGAYLATSKTMWRLNRPTWIPGKGQGTRSERICKRRRTNDPEKILSTIYEVYCENLECK